MELANCRDCGELFYRHGSNRRCPNCLKAEEQALLTVRDHLRDSRERSIPRIAEATGIAIAKILRWVRQKRLHVELVPGDLRCHRCHVAVTEGTFCDKCRKELAKQVAEQRKIVERHIAGEPDPPPPSPTPAAPAAGMHYHARSERKG